RRSVELHIIRRLALLGIQMNSHWEGFPCCDNRLPFKRQRQQSFATSSSSEAKVAMYAAKPVVFATLGESRSPRDSTVQVSRSHGEANPLAKNISGECEETKSELQLY